MVGWNFGLRLKLYTPKLHLNGYNNMPYAIFYMFRELIYYVIPLNFVIY
jgi:hypothetical protein